MVRFDNVLGGQVQSDVCIYDPGTSSSNQLISTRSRSRSCLLGTKASGVIQGDQLRGIVCIRWGSFGETDTGGLEIVDWISWWRKFEIWRDGLEELRILWKSWIE